MKTKGILILAALYLVWPLYQVFDYIGGQPMADALDNFNYAASILSYDWLLLNVLLGLKIPVLQRRLPYDFRVQAHIVTSLAVTAFLVWHSVYYLFLRVKQIDLTTWALMGSFGALLALSLLWIPVPGLRRVRSKVLSWLKTGVLKSYDGLKAIHKGLFVVLAGLTYLHILDAKLIGVASPASSFGFQFLFFVTAAAFLWTRIQNLTLPTLEVLSVVSEAGITRLSLSGHPRFRYRSGQFAFLRFQHPELKDEEHPFSFVSAPHDGTVEFAVKDLGDFTRRLSRLNPGDKVKVNGGFGAFHPGRGRRPLVLIGSGIGSAPLVSILKDLSARQPHREVVCFVAAPSRKEILDLDRLEQLASSMPNLTLRLLATDEGAPRFSAELLRSAVSDPGRCDFFLCSSEKVRRILLGILASLGVPKRKIHYETFGLGW